ncbi:hypothetical protein ACRAWF_27890 [Streptomyces sp. L7]
MERRSACAHSGSRSSNGLAGDGSQPHGELLIADRDPHLAEVVVLDPAFPQPRGADHGAQHPGLGMPPGQRELLLDHGPLHGTPALRQVAQIVPAFTPQPLLAVAPASRIT